MAHFARAVVAVFEIYNCMHCMHHHFFCNIFIILKLLQTYIRLSKKRTHKKIYC